MTRKDVKNIKQMHSKRTGAIILIAFAFLLVGGSVFMYLAMQENEKFEIELDNFQALSCEEMKKETDIIKFNADLYGDYWKYEVYLGKIRAGEC